MKALFNSFFLGLLIFTWRGYSAPPPLALELAGSEDVEIIVSNLMAEKLEKSFDELVEKIERLDGEGEEKLKAKLREILKKKMHFLKRHFSRGEGVDKRNAWMKYLALAPFALMRILSWSIGTIIDFYIIMSVIAGETTLTSGVLGLAMILVVVAVVDSVIQSVQSISNAALTMPGLIFRSFERVFIVPIKLLEKRQLYPVARDIYRTLHVLRALEEDPNSQGISELTDELVRELREFDDELFRNLLIEIEKRKGGDLATKAFRENLCVSDAASFLKSPF